MNRAAVFASFSLVLFAFAASPGIAQCAPIEEGGVLDLGSGTDPDVAVFADGSGIAVWTSGVGGGADDGSRSGILARTIDSSGQFSGDEFQVNTWIEQDQFNPRVAVNEAGRMVIAWTSDTSPGDADSTSVRARVYRPNGSPIGNDFQVNTSVAGGQSDVDVAFSDEGTIVVVWYDPGGSAQRDVRGRLFDVNGNPLGGEITLNARTDGTQQAPSVGMAPDGRFVAAWQSSSSAGNDNSSTSIQVRRFDADGTPLDAQEFQGNNHTPDLQGDPAVAVDADGSFVVAWEARRSSPGNDQSAFSVHARGFQASGTPAGVQQQVNQLIDDDQFDPRVAAVGGGEFLIAFVSDAEVANVTRNVRVRAMTLEGQFLGPERTGVAESGSAAVSGNRNGGSIVASRRAGGDILTQAFVHPCATGGSGPSDCQVGDANLCLAQDRFRVTVDWRDAQGNRGAGQAIGLTADTGYFWFFDRDNVEMVLKVLNACSFADRFWVFAGGLTNVKVDITVEDTESGTMRTYSNPLSTPFQPIQDTDAFATCP